MKSAVIIVNDKTQSGYSYQLSAETGMDFDRAFHPDLTPPELLRLGSFCGKYMTDCTGEFPPNWFEGAKLASGRRDCSLISFGVGASQPLSVWRRNGWIYRDDPRGWFQWYCRYYMGRRLPDEDARQIKRWKAMRRHIGQILRNCVRGDLTCRRRQRQALLHWAYTAVRYRPVAGHNHAISTANKWRSHRHHQNRISLGRNGIIKQHQLVCRQLRSAVPKGGNEIRFSSPTRRQLVL